MSGSEAAAEVPPVATEGLIPDGRYLTAPVDRPGMAEDGAQGVSEVSPGEVSMSEGSALDRFYRDLLWELDEFVRRPSATAIGAAVVVKRVALAHEIESAERLPLPRYSRAEREERSETDWGVASERSR